MGKKIPREKIEQILSALGYEVTYKDGTYDVIVPSWRATGDVTLKDDVMGDIARILSFDSFEPKNIDITIEHAIKQNDVLLDRRIKEYLFFVVVFMKIYTYPWIDLARQYLLQDWDTPYPIETYTASTADSTAYELPLADTPILPVPTSHLFEQKGYSVIRTTPYGNSLTLELAKAVLKGEQLGQGPETDMLTVSLSSTDYVGHQFGTYAIETEDTYLRLDRDLADFFRTLDETIGKNNYLLFLTADHAAAHNFRLMQDCGIPAGGWYAGTVKDSLNAVLDKQFGSGHPLVKDILNYQVFFDHAYIRQANIDLRAAKACAIDFLKSYPQFAYVADMEDLSNATQPADVRERAINGYNRLRSVTFSSSCNPAGTTLTDLKNRWYRPRRMESL